MYPKKRVGKLRDHFTQGVMQFFWFVVAGSMATAVHYAVLVALVELLGFSAAPSAAIGTLCGAAVSYWLNRRMAFSSTNAGHVQTLPRFAAIAVLGAVLNGVLVWLGVHVLGWHYLLAQLLATLLVMGLTFQLHRIWTFA